MAKKVLTPKQKEAKRFARADKKRAIENIKAYRKKNPLKSKKTKKGSKKGGGGSIG